METVIKKLRFKENAVVLNAPTDLKNDFAKLGFEASFDKKKKSINTLAFVNTQKELITFLDKQLKNVEPDSLFWVAYPKQTSGIKTDINRDTIHVTTKLYDLKTVSAIAINDTWSAMRLRPTDKVGT